MFSPDCRQRHVGEDGGEQDDDNEGEDASGEGFELGLLLVADKLGGGKEVGLVHC